MKIVYRSESLNDKIIFISLSDFILKRLQIFFASPLLLPGLLSLYSLVVVASSEGSSAHDEGKNIRVFSSFLLHFVSCSIIQCFHENKETLGRKVFPSKECFSFLFFRFFSAPTFHDGTEEKRKKFFIFILLVLQRKIKNNEYHL